MKNKTIAIIPARGGSKRLPGKNIRLLDNVPLIVYSIRYAQQHQFIDEVYVTTDDPEIKEIALQYGARIINRPYELSGDLEPTVSALKHVVETIEEKVENVVLLQPTNPLRPEKLLTEAFHIFEEKKCESLFTVTRNHHKLGKIESDRFVPFNYEPGQRSQDLAPLYYENGLLYIVKSALLLESKIISDDAYPMVVNHPYSSVDVDTEDDFNYAEYLISMQK